MCTYHDAKQRTTVADVHIKRTLEKIVADAPMRRWQVHDMQQVLTMTAR